MPINKAARFRFEIIDECLRNTKKKWSKAELLRFVNRRLELQYGEGHTISKSQLRYDLEHMQSECGAPIQMYKSAKNYYYTYEDPNFSIRNIPIDEEDILKLNTALQVIQQITGLSIIADDIGNVMKKLEARYDFNTGEHRKIIILGTSSNISGRENLEDVYLAILRKNVLKITYSPHNSETLKIYNIHPYLLKEFNNIWYIVGYCQEGKKIDIYELDRMSEIKISKLPFITDPFLKAEDHFHDLIGVTKPTEKIEVVKLLFTCYKAPYILSYPIHSSQEVVAEYDNGFVEITLKVIVNEELTNLLLSYGSEVKVLSPKYLANQIAWIAQKLLKSYDIS